METLMRSSRWVSSRMPSWSSSIAPEGEVAAELAEGAEFQHVVHQASGTVAIQLGMSVSRALIRLRAHVFASERPLHTVARHVIDRTLVFDVLPGGEATGP
jgi:hypothetical protein